MEKVEKKDKVMKTSLIILVVVVVVFAGALIFAGKNASIGTESQVMSMGEKASNRSELKSVIANIGGTHLTAAVASKDADRKQGLSNVKSISPNEGQMFTFEKEGFYSFHMKDMNFALDFIFVNDQGTVVDIVKNISPEYDGTITSQYPASVVFEVNAGWADQNEIEVGDTVVSTTLDK